MASPSGFFYRIKAATKGLAARFRPRPPGMIGTPPSQRPMWHDPAAHALDFSRRYAEDIDLAVSQRVMDLGIHISNRCFQPQ